VNQVKIRTGDCVKCGNCYGGLPEVFGADDDGTAFVLNPKGALEPDLQKALDDCTGSCIEWVSVSKNTEV